MLDIPGFTPVTPTADIRVERHGNRAKCLQRLIRMDLPVPQTVAIPFAPSVKSPKDRCPILPP